MADESVDVCSGESELAVGEKDGEAEDAAFDVADLQEHEKATRGKVSIWKGQGRGGRDALDRQADVLGLDLHELKQSSDLRDSERGRGALEKVGDLADLQVVGVVPVCVVKKSSRKRHVRYH